MCSIRSQYLNAFNIPDFLHMTDKSQHQNVQTINTKCLVVEVDNAHSICTIGDTQDFLYKMLGAIGLQKQDVAFIQANTSNLEQQVSNYKAQTILLLDSKISLNANSIFTTHHPSEIVKNEQLKREAWEVLKQLKICLK